MLAGPVAEPQTTGLPPTGLPVPAVQRHVGVDDADELLDGCDGATAAVVGVVVVEVPLPVTYSSVPA